MPANRAVVFRAEYGTGYCWAYFGLGNRSTPYLAVDSGEVYPIQLTGGRNCLGREPFRIAVPMRPLPGPLVVIMFAPSPWWRGASGAAAGAGAPVTSSPWGVPTAARLALVKS